MDYSKLQNQEIIDYGNLLITTAVYSESAMVIGNKLLLFKVDGNYKIVDLTTKEVVGEGQIAGNTSTYKYATVMNNKVYIAYSASIGRFSISNNQLVEEIGFKNVGGAFSSSYNHIFNDGKYVYAVRLHTSSSAKQMTVVDSDLNYIRYFPSDAYSFSENRLPNKIYDGFFGHCSDNLGLVVYKGGNDYSGTSLFNYIGIFKASSFYVLENSSTPILFLTNGTSFEVIRVYPNSPTIKPVLLMSGALNTVFGTTSINGALSPYSNSLLTSNGIYKYSNGSFTKVYSASYPLDVAAHQVVYLGETSTRLALMTTRLSGKIVFYDVNSAPTSSTIPSQSTTIGVNKTVNLSSYFSDADGDVLTYTASSSTTNIVTVSVSGSTLTLQPVALGSTTITVTASDGKGGTKSTTFTLNVTNKLPIVSLTSPANNQTLYEGDTITISGTANDTNIGDVVTVRYQINALTPVAILPFVADGAAKVFSKQLTFKTGSLYDGETLIANNLADGVAHTLKVYATDDKNGQSVIAERTVYVVPNRAPSLTVNTPVITGTIDNDKFTVNGSYNDADGNTTTVKYRINGGNSVQVASGTSGVFDFEVSFAQLTAGPNSIVIEAIDSYGAKTSKTVKLNKNVVSTEQLRSTARYKILPPSNKAQAVLSWIERDKDLTIDVAISMTMAGEAESFVPVTVSESVPIVAGSNTYEDTFFYEADAPKDNIIVQIDMTRKSVDADDKITLISGVLE